MKSRNRRFVEHAMRQTRGGIAAAAVLVAILPIQAHAQDSLTSFIRGTTTAKPYFAAFDVRPANISPVAVQEAVAASFRVHYNDIIVNQQMVPYPLPAKAPRMSFVQVQSSLGPISSPVCNGASAVVSSSDSTMMRYEEVTILQACIFPYKDGSRVNVYAFFGQKSGASSIATLGASMGRAFTNAVGLGDSSKFIDETIDDINQRLASLSAEVRLVELMPERAGRPTVAEVASPMAAADISAPPAVAAGGLLPASVQVQLAAARAAMASAQGALSAQSSGSPAAVIQARKDLTAMGLSYYSQEQFVEAVKRGDEVAFVLFIRAGGVDPGRADKSGMTPLQHAKAPAVVAVLRQGLKQ